jgi:S-adenosylmethionine:tRNA ribosyltransferase-isomerase
MTLLTETSALDFDVSSDLIAPAPAEVRGRGRDDVRMMVAGRASGRIEHRRFPELSSVLAPGDVVVINISATIPAALDGFRADGTEVRLHLSTRLPGNLWIVELRRPVGPGSLPLDDGRAPETVRLAAGASAELLAPQVGRGKSSRLWIAALQLPVPVLDFLGAYGKPVRYGNHAQAWPLEYYQTVYATTPGSAEMPSAGRAFTPEIITQLVARGVAVAPVLLHTGVSSLEAHEPPFEEHYRVPPETARQINVARAAGGRVIAVGTTVVRALETVATGAGEIGAGEGWTGLIITPKRGVHAVDGLLTGWHEPHASHLDLVQAVGGRTLIETSYRAAVEHGYLWHEFGDLHLVIR